MKICRLCEKNSVDSAIDFGNQPIIHNLSKTPNEGYESYSFKLGHCFACGFLQLLHPIPPELPFIFPDGLLLKVELFISTSDD